MPEAAQLLPPNATTLEKRVARANAGISDVSIPVRDVWDPATCPVSLLPWMAWGFGVDQWDSGWSEAQKREAIASALYVQRHKGTIGAVRRALAALGYDIVVQEWFNQIPAGEPYTFDVLIDSSQVGIDEAGLARIMRIIDTFKNLRSHLRSIRPSITTRGGPTVANALTTGNEITVMYEGMLPSDCVLDGSWELDGTISMSGLKV
ncbi:phage tail protein I [Burkholderia sp. Bp9015]|uniref:phage tail protein I n=1 Tax=Burkholderia sp. Bp9015 TaxID=2184563 RepID=UPI000F59C274|nr:phage tail protein I [Burkholderia sp. Bp9015]RQR78686.1 phage tail protein I [Burkholderia sp. Bp9015]